MAWRTAIAGLLLSFVSSASAIGQSVAPDAAIPATTAPAPSAPPAPEPAAATPTAATAPLASANPAATTVLAKIGELPPGQTDEERKELTELLLFYTARAGEPLWVESKGLSARGAAVVNEVKNAGDWGLEAKDFALPDLPAAADGKSDAGIDVIANAELKLTLAVLKYARFARGGRIMAPSELLNSNLDRRPQLVEPKAVLEGLTSASDAAAYLRGLHPQQPQFEKLRQAYLKLRGSKPGKPLKADGARVLANMEEWRWMTPDMGDVHVVANIPEFMLRVYNKGEMVHSERIVAGEVGKQSSVFSRRLKYIVFRPKWKVPESIKVRELWPSLKRGGGLMRQYGLELETKDGKPLNWREIDWSSADIRNYDVIQAPGKKSVLGNVKFSFPSQHTIYMHDTPDKWMFNASQRTLSHGCLRVRNPLKLAEILLGADKGWDRAKIDELVRNGPLNNEVAIDGRIPIHLTYFTAWIDDAGKLKTFADVYGHEKRITLALAGKWDRIEKGRDHLAPPEPLSGRETAARNIEPRGQSKEDDSFGDYQGAALRGGGL